MNVLDRILTWAARQRGFVLGPGVVDWGDEVWGRDKARFVPTSHGDYIASSSAVYTCATLRASLLKSLPLQLYRTNRRKEPIAVERGPLIDLLAKVNPYWTWGRLIEMTELSLCLWGEAFWFLERGPSGLGEPREIWWGRPDRTSVVPHPTEYVRGFLYEPVNGSKDIPFLPSEVIWLRYANPLDEYSGLSPLGSARLAADYSTKALSANNQLFDNGFNIGGIVMPDNKDHRELTADQAKELDRYFDRRFGGKDKAHRWAFMRHAYQIWQGSMTPKDADFLGGLNWSLEEVARTFKVPLDLIGGQRTYANVEAALVALWQHCLLPEAQFIAEELTEQLLPMFPAQAGEYIELDTSKVHVLQEAEDVRWSRADTQIQRGALLINEWRKTQNLEPVPWGDVWWAAGGLRPIANTGDTVKLDQATPAPGDAGAASEQQDSQDQGANDAADLEQRYVAALDTVRQRQVQSREAGASLNTARWLKEYRVALRQAGASESEAQRLARIVMEGSCTTVDS